MTYYLTKFPSAYRNRRWWSARSKKRAEAFLRKIKEKYGVEGKIILVFEKPTNKTMKKTQKLKISVWKAKDGFRWHFKRGGRIIAESGEAYCRMKTCTKAIENIIHCFDVCAFEWVLPKT